MKTIIVNLVNIFDCTVFKAELSINQDRIFQVRKLGDEDLDLPYAMPGFVEAHVHIESSMMTPSQFGRLAVVHGTVGSVSDPHEIANVMGIKGVEYMIEDGKKVPFKFCFGAPSCVPATQFETAGAEIGVNEIERLMDHNEIGYLAEMMNFPGVLNNDETVVAKIKLAQKYNKPIDGHAPALRGDLAKKYFGAGISTDHECFTLEEAEEKLNLGVKILIREGSAAKNFEALIPLAHKYDHLMMFCSDDKHPNDLAAGHINLLVKRAIECGIDLYKVLRMACLNPVRHYNLDIGLLREGEKADFILVKDLSKFEILSTFIDGEKVAENGVSLLNPEISKIINNFNTKPIHADQIKLNFEPEMQILKVIKVLDGQLITESFEFTLPTDKTKIEKALQTYDIQKLVVYNRYNHEKPSIAYIHGFSIKNGAIASSVAHDSHNIIAVGSNDEYLVDAINLIVKSRGGVSAVSENLQGVLALPIAGLMSEKDGYTIAKDYDDLDKFTKEKLGSALKSPFMSLSFMALLVIPSLKLSDLGLFDGNKFEFVNLTH